MRRLSRLLKPNSDEALLEAFAAGDAAAFNELYARNKDGLYNFVLRTLTNPAAAEEVAQEAWMAVVAGADSFKPVDAKFRTWLYRIASNKVADFFRKKANLTHAEFDTVNEHQLDEQFTSGQQRQLGSEEMVLLDQLLAALSELPEEQRVTFILQQEGFSHREIADITGVGSETVKSRLRYAKDATRTRMEVKA